MMMVVFGIASVESLLSSSAVDKLARSKVKHDPDQELIGQVYDHDIFKKLGF